jgi:hypothetical protein
VAAAHRLVSAWREFPPLPFRPERRGGLYLLLFLLIVATAGVTLCDLHVEHLAVPMSPIPSPRSVQIGIDAAIEAASFRDHFDDDIAEARPTEFE